MTKQITAGDSLAPRAMTTAIYILCLYLIFHKDGQLRLRENASNQAPENKSMDLFTAKHQMNTFLRVSVHWHFVHQRQLISLILAVPYTQDQRRN